LIETEIVAHRRDLLFGRGVHAGVDPGGVPRRGMEQREVDDDRQQHRRDDREELAADVRAHSLS
jgi:hypothetical protein